MRYIMLMLLCSILVASIHGQTLVREIALDKPLVMTADEAGNVYVAMQDKSIHKWNSDGDSMGIYRQVKYGTVGYLDATNPLELLIVYPDFNKLEMLDRMMTPKATIDLTSKGWYNIQVIAQSMDGKYWLYDQVNGKLIKFNQQLVVELESVDLRTLGISLMEPVQIQERNGRVVILDAEQGAVVFDRYANYIEQIPLNGIRNIQLMDQKLVWVERNLLKGYQIDNGLLDEVDLQTDDILSCRIFHQRIFVLTANSLKIFTF